MTRVASGAAAGLLALASLAAAGGTSRPSAPDAADLARQADLLAAESLTHTALSLLHTSGVPRGGRQRLLALCGSAHHLSSRDARPAEVLLDLYEAQGQYARAVRSAEVCLRARPGDRALGRRWLALRMALLQDADRRAQFLRRVIARADYPASLRAAAGVEYAALLSRQGHSDRARAQYQAVLRAWDPLEPHALRGLLALQGDPSVVDETATRLKLLGGNPSAVDVAWRQAVALDGLGLHAAAMEFFDYVWQVARRKNAADRVSHTFLAQYFNAMLNAGRFAEAAEKLPRATRRFPRSLDLAALLCETYRALGKQDQAEQQLIVLGALSKPGRDAEAISAPQAKGLAMFHLVSRPDAERALAFARLARRTEPNDPVVLRLLGAAELRSGDRKLIEQGRRRLEALAGRDLYAAAFLCEHLYAAGDAPAARKTLLAGLARGGTGPALRRLVARARKHNVPVPAPAGQAEAGRLVSAFDRKVLDLALHPDKHIAVSLLAPPAPPPAGDPVPLTAVLTNTSTLPIRLGDWGLLNPRLDVSVTVAASARAGASAPPRAFERLLLVRWPAPTCLKPGQALRVTARIDVGPLETYLAQRPLDELTLTVRATLDPVEAGKTLRSWLPSVAVAPLRIVRPSLLGAPLAPGAGAAPEAYRKLLLDITRAIKRGGLAARMRAARRVGALLGLVRNVELRRARLPAGLAKTVTKPMLLSMMAAMLADRAPAVRAEMLAALQQVPLGDQILRLLAPSIEDSGSLVRLRLVELLGASSTPGRRTIVNYLARDTDERVRLMASAFQSAPAGR